MDVLSLKRLLVFIEIFFILSDFVTFAKPSTKTDLEKNLDYFLNSPWPENNHKKIQSILNFPITDMDDITSTTTPKVSLDNRRVATVPETCEKGKKMDIKHKACRVDLG